MTRETDAVVPATSYEHAVVEVVGALAYGQLRSFVATAQLAGLAPDAAMADQIADIAMHEHAGYLALRDYLAARTDDAAGAMERQRSYFDDYFDQAPLDDWLGGVLFFALGLPMAADFSRAIAPALPDDTAEVVTSTLGERGELARQAHDQLVRMLGEPAALGRARQLTADMLGRALTGFQGVMTATDALKVVLAADTAPDETAEGRVKRLAIDVLEAHRRRAVQFGLDDLDDIL